MDGRSGAVWPVLVWPVRPSGTLHDAETCRIFFRHDAGSGRKIFRGGSMSRRRNGTNQAMIQLGLNRYKLGKKKRPGAATPVGAEKIAYTGKYSR